MLTPVLLDEFPQREHKPCRNEGERPFRKINVSLMQSVMTMTLSRCCVSEMMLLLMMMMMMMAAAAAAVVVVMAVGGVGCAAAAAAAGASITITIIGVSVLM